MPLLTSLQKSQVQSQLQQQQTQLMFANNAGIVAGNACHLPCADVEVMEVSNLCLSNNAFACSFAYSASSVTLSVFSCNALERLLAIKSFLRNTFTLVEMSPNALLLASCPCRRKVCQSKGNRPLHPHHVLINNDLRPEPSDIGKARGTLLV